jgi:23S rRNA pseudouridine2457 synthase
MHRTVLPTLTSQTKYVYFKINKPYGVLSQFRDKTGRKTLADIFNMPKNVYPVGRLDFDSEGLLLLTNDKKITDHLLNPLNRHEREYYVQVEGIPGEKDLIRLIDGVIIQKNKTLPAQAKLIEPPDFPPRMPPIRIRKNIPTSWISIILHEGKNRQVRRMTAYLGYPTLRLIRVRIKNITFGNLSPGGIKELTIGEIMQLKQ